MDLEPTLSVDKDGNRRWKLNGRLHRTDGPTVEYANGTCAWYLNDQLHRTNGPAIVWPDGRCHWYLNGQRHRADGPASEMPDGTRAWYLNGQHYTFWQWLNAMNVDEHTRLLMTLKYSS